MDSSLPRTTHLEARQLEALRRGTLDTEETRSIRNHLAEACAGCARAVAGILVERYGDAPRPAGRGASPIVDKAPIPAGATLRRHEEAAAWEEAVAPGLARSLELWEEAEAFRLIAEEPAYGTFALARRLTEECRRRVIVDAAGAYHLGRLAVAVAAYAPDERYGRGLCSDLRGEAAMALGNAARCCSRLYEARRALKMAEDFLEEGTGDVELSFRLSNDRASMAKALGYYRQALELFESAWARLERAEASKPARDLQLWAVKRATLVGGVDRRHGVLLHRAVLRQLGRRGSPWLRCCAHVNLACCLHHAGRDREALRELEELETSGLFSSSEKTFVNLSRTKAQVLLGLGSLHEAAEVLTDLRSRQIVVENPLDLAAVTVDLAEVALARGSSSTARRLAAEGEFLFATIGAELHARQAANLLARH